MCLYCHEKLSNETLKEQIMESMKDPCFEKWNLTSLQHLNIIISGHDGEEAAILAKELFQSYLKWLDNKIIEINKSKS